MPIAVALLVTTALYAGFQWTIRLVVYPQFAGVGSGEFPAYEAAHQQRVSWAVGPLFLGVGVSTLLALIVEPGWLAVTSAILFAAVLVLTAIGAVPQHRTLGGGYDRAAHHRLLRVDSARLLLAVADVVVAVGLVRQGW